MAVGSRSYSGTGVMFEFFLLIPYMLWVFVLGTGWYESRQKYNSVEAIWYHIVTLIMMLAPLVAFILGTVVECQS